MSWKLVLGLWMLACPVCFVLASVLAASMNRDGKVKGDVGEFALNQFLFAWFMVAMVLTGAKLVFW